MRIDNNSLDTNRIDTNRLDTNRLIEKADNYRYYDWDLQKDKNVINELSS